MILHIFNDQKKFSKGYFEMLQDNKLLAKDTHLIHYGKKDDFFEKMGIKTVFIRDFFNPFSNFKMIGLLFKADKIIVHSLASPYLLFMLLFKSIVSKVYWVIWGKDLYFYHMLDKPKIHHKIYECLRKTVIKRIPNICSIFEEDYKLAC